MQTISCRPRHLAPVSLAEISLDCRAGALGVKPFSDASPDVAHGAALAGMAVET